MPIFEEVFGVAKSMLPSTQPPPRRGLSEGVKRGMADLRLRRVIIAPSPPRRLALTGADSSPSDTGRKFGKHGGWGSCLRFWLLSASSCMKNTKVDLGSSE